MANYRKAKPRRWSGIWGSARNAGGSWMRIGKRAMRSRRTATRTPMRRYLLSLLSAAEDRCGRRGRFPRLRRLRPWSPRFSCLRRAIRHSAVVGTAAEIGSYYGRFAARAHGAAGTGEAVGGGCSAKGDAAGGKEQRSGADKPSRSRSTHRSSASSRGHEFIARRAGGGDFHPCRCHFPSGRGSRGREFHSRRHDGERWFGGTDSAAAATDGI